MATAGGIATMAIWIRCELVFPVFQVFVWLRVGSLWTSRTTAVLCVFSAKSVGASRLCIVRLRKILITRWFLVISWNTVQLRFMKCRLNQMGIEKSTIAHVCDGV